MTRYAIVHNWSCLCLSHLLCETFCGRILTCVLIMCASNVGRKQYSVFTAKFGLALRLIFGSTSRVDEFGLKKTQKRLL